MIKKLNIALLVIVGLLFLLKTAVNRAHSRKIVEPDVEVVTVENPDADLAPTVYYTRMSPYCAPNRITNRNGLGLDIIRAIFPKASFVNNVDTSSGHLARKALLQDPHGATIGYGDHQDLIDLPRAKTCITAARLCLYLPRDSTFVFTGPESLDKLRIGWDSDFNCSKVLAAFAAKWKDTAGKAVIIDTGASAANVFWPMVESGKLDAYVNPPISAAASIETDDAKAFVNSRRSKVIDTFNIYFRTSNLDPEYSRRLIDAFDRGMKRLHESGEWERLTSYYFPGKDVTSQETFRAVVNHPIGK